MGAALLWLHTTRSGLPGSPGFGSCLPETHSPGCHPSLLEEETGSPRRARRSGEPRRELALAPRPRPPCSPGLGEAVGEGAERTDSVNRAGLGLGQGRGVLAQPGCEAHPRLSRTPRPAGLPRGCPAHGQLQPGCVWIWGSGQFPPGDVFGSGGGFALRAVIDRSFPSQVSGRRPTGLCTSGLPLVLPAARGTGLVPSGS